MLRRAKIIALTILAAALALIGLRATWVREGEARVRAESAKDRVRRLQEARNVEKDVDHLGGDDLRERAARWVRDQDRQ